MFYIVRKRVNIDHVYDRYFKDYKSAVEAFDEAVSNLKKEFPGIDIVSNIDEFNRSKGIYMKETFLIDNEDIPYTISIIETYFEDKPNE